MSALPEIYQPCSLCGGYVHLDGLKIYRGELYCPHCHALLAEMHAAGVLGGQGRDSDEMYDAGMAGIVLVVVAAVIVGALIWIC